MEQEKAAMIDDKPTNDKAGRRDKPEPRRHGAKTKRSSAKKVMKKTAKK